MGEGKLYINGLEIEEKQWDEVSADEDSLAIDVPNHVIIDKFQCVKIIADLDMEDAAKLEEVLPGVDFDKFQNKRVRIFLQPLGPIPKNG